VKRARPPGPVSGGRGRPDRWLRADYAGCNWPFTARREQETLHFLSLSSPDSTAGPAIDSVSVVPGDLGFIRSDANVDGRVDIGDAIWLVNELFRMGSVSTCQDAADANDDGLVDLSDVSFILSFRFGREGSTPPSAPFPVCGPDPTGDDVDCASYSCP